MLHNKLNPAFPANSVSPDARQGELHGELEKINRDLSTLSKTEIHRRATDDLGSTQEGITVEHLRNISAARARRREFFPSDLFADPAWDILLCLYECEALKQAVSVTGVCSASGVPASTALRWLTNLERHGLIERHDDEDDRRRVYVNLTEKGQASMTAYFASCIKPVIERGLL